MAEMMDRTINAVLTALIAVVLIGAAFIPIAVKEIDSVAGLVSANADITLYVTLLGVVVIMTIIGIVVGVIKNYTSEGKR